MAPPVNPRYRRPKERVYRKGHCCWCGRTPLPKGRRDWCSDRCVQEYLSFDPQTLRQRCWERDRGVCQGCGRDIAALERRLLARLGGAFLRRDGVHNDGRARLDRTGRPSRWQDAWGRVQHGTPDWRALDRRSDRWRRLLRRLGVKRSHLWEADHKIPVCEGGLNCLANLRTLCLPCHKSETRQLAARRAKARRQQQELQLDGERKAVG